MKSYRGLTLRYLLSQKKRTILIIIGIILSVALLSAAGVFGESLKSTMLERIKQNYGDYHASYAGINQAQLKLLQGNAKVAKVGYGVRAGVDQMAKGQDLIVTGADQNFCQMLYLTLQSGRWPQQDNEIALEQWVLDSLKISPHIGERITLNLDIAGKSSGLDKADLVKGTVQRQFILSGILKNRNFMSSGISYGIVTPSTAQKLMHVPDLQYTAHVLIKQGFPLQPTITELEKDLGLKEEQVNQNTALLTALNQSANNSANGAVLVIEAIAILVILVTSIAVIYNAFHISVLERIHQFGVLRSVGTTPRQIRTIVLGEALLLSVIAIPIGLLCGVVAVKGVIGIFATRFSNFPDFQVVVPLWVLAGTACLGLITVLASAYGPARSAGKVSPMEAILNNARQKMSKFKPRRHSLLGRIWGIEGVMAFENIKRSKKRFYVTVASISIGIMLFIFFSYFMNLLLAGTQGFFHQDFDVERAFASDQRGYTQQDYTEVSQLPGVTRVYRVMQKNALALVTNSQASSTYRKFVSQTAQDRNYKYNGTQYLSIPAYVYGYRDMELQLFKNNLLQGSVDLNALHDNGVIVTQMMQDKGLDKTNASNLKVGDEIEVISPTTAKKGQPPLKLKVVGILDKMPLNYAGGPDKYGLITSEATFQKLTGDNTFARFDIAVSRTADRTAIFKQLQSIANRVPQSRALDFSGTDTPILFIGTILYGLLTVLSVIGAINIINTISTNLILRQREFGTLRALGMTMGQMKKMIRLEGVLYGLAGTFYGAIAGCLLARLIYVYYVKIDKLIWQFPWQPTLEGAVVAVIIGVLATAAPIKRIGRMNVVDALRIED